MERGTYRYNEDTGEIEVVVKPQPLAAKREPEREESERRRLYTGLYL
jgi:hypothetical protein